VYARGNRRQEVFIDDEDRWKYLELLGRTVERRHWQAMAYCLMGNHVHLLIETREPNLGAGMQWLHGCYAQAFNQRHHHVGHLFQDRYGSTRIESDVQLWTVVRYIALNPVQAGLCLDPRGWRWGSHGATAAGAAPTWLAVERLGAYLTAAAGISAVSTVVATEPAIAPG
jgi:putative transposase